MMFIFPRQELSGKPAEAEMDKWFKAVQEQQNLVTKWLKTARTKLLEIQYMRNTQTTEHSVRPEFDLQRVAGLAGQMRKILIWVKQQIAKILQSGE